MSNPLCPVCAGRASRSGSLKELKAKSFKYVYLECGRHFSTFTATVFYYSDYAPWVVALVLELCNQYGLPLREAGRLLDKRFNARVPKSTLCDWNA